MTQRFVNNFGTTLAATLGASDTFMGVASTDGLPSLGPGEFCLLTLYRGYGIEESGYEVVKVTAIAPKQLTVERAYEGAAPSLFLAGTRVEARNTARSMEAKLDKNVGDAIANSIAVLRSDVAKIAAATGDTLTTARALAAPDWLRCDGSDYLSSSYPVLATLLGPVRDLVKLPDPASLPAAGGVGMSYSGDGVYLAISHFTTPFITVYKQTAGVYGKLAALPTITNTGNCAAFSPDGIHLAVGGENSPYLTIFKRTGDTFAKLTVTTGITAVVSAMAFSPDGTYLAVGHDSTPFLSIFKRAGDVFTKLADPATIPSGTSVRTVAFSPDGQHLMIGKTSAPNMMVYKRAGDVFTNLTGIPYISAVQGAAYSPDSKYLVTGQFLAPYLAIYARSADTYTQVYNINKTPVAQPSSIAFSPITGELAISVFATPGVALYQRNGDDFKISDGLPTVTASPGVGFSPVGYDLAVGLNATPFVNVIRGIPDTTRVRMPNLPSSDSRLINYIKT